MYIAIVCIPGGDAIDYEIDLISLIKPFSYITKNSRQTFKYFQSRKRF